MIQECRGLKYKERLTRCRLVSLEKRRVRGDLIETFKIMKGFEKVNYNSFFTLNNLGRTRGHNLKMVKSRNTLELRRNFFSQRVVDEWNSLPQEVVDAVSVNQFKNRLDKFARYGGVREN